MSATSKLSRWRQALPYLVLVGLVLLVWGQTVKFGFVYDDLCFIEDLQSIRSLKHVPEMLYSLDAQSSYPKGFVVFRPLRTIHYAVLCALGGGEPKPWLFHVANVLWHAGVAMLLFRLLRLLFLKELGEEKAERAEWFALLGAAAFALHPVVSEVVCWAKCLDDLMATAFVLAACHRLVSWEPANAVSRRHFWWALAYFGLAVYSKESAVPLALFIVVLFHFYKRIRLHDVLRYAAPFFAITVVFLLHRHLVIGRSSQTAPLSGSYVQTLIDTLPAAPIYLRLLAGFPPFAIDYSYMKAGQALSSPAVLGGLLLVLAVPLLATVALRRKEVVAGVALLWIALFMLPVANLMPMMQYCAERFLYLPLIGWVVLLVWLLQRVNPVRLALSVGTLIILAWAGVAWNRSWIWQDGLTLFVQSHLEGPPTQRIQQGAAWAAFRLPHVRVAFGCTQVPGELPQVRLNSPEALLQANWPAIERTLDELHRVMPTNPAVATVLGITKAYRHKMSEAVALSELAVREQPEHIGYRNNLGLAYVKAGELTKAQSLFQEVLAREPTNLTALQALSSIFWRQGNFAAARPVLEKLRELDPADSSYDYWLNQLANKTNSVKESGP